MAIRVGVAVLRALRLAGAEGRDGGTAIEAAASNLLGVYSTS